ncbi:MAG TPA: flagellar hook-length control protein FliK [Marmoricola sp.]|nr:flagellar hook-length control protein FliK [Marmoricola sp.]
MTQLSIAPTTTAHVDHIAARVFGEVTGLVSRGNGTHRISLTLHPHDLGEVRVVMTMRDGAVHVRLAAGHEAKAALLEGSDELGRLLAHAGATESRIVVRDLPATPAPAQDPTTPTGTTGTPLGASTDRAPDQHAGTRADHPARDGSDTTGRSARTAPATAPRSIQPVTGTRVAGVDLTM